MRKNSQWKNTLTLKQTLEPNKIAFNADKQGACFAEVRALPPSVRKISHNPIYLAAKTFLTLQVLTLNLNITYQLPRLTAASVELYIDIICIHEHRYNHIEIDL